MKETRTDANENKSCKNTINVLNNRLRCAYMTMRNAMTRTRNTIGHIMTKLNMNNDATTNEKIASNERRSRRQRNRVVVRDIALKTILNDIIRDDKTRTLTTKQMRVVLRREFATSMQHAKNNAWTFDANEYVIVRSRFDAKYRAKNERATKRASRKNANANVETTNA